MSLASISIECDTKNFTESIRDMGITIRDNPDIFRKYTKLGCVVTDGLNMCVWMLSRK